MAGRRRRKVEEEQAETPQSIERRIEVEQKEEAKARNKTLDIWYELKGDKVVKCTKKANGNSYRLFQFMKSKNKESWDALVAEHGQPKLA